MTTLDNIRQAIIDRNYYLSSHAEDEMVDDLLERRDVENAILTGVIDKTLTKDIRGYLRSLLATDLETDEADRSLITPRTCIRFIRFRIRCQPRLIASQISF